MEFEDIDFDRCEWRSPGSKTKNGKVHTLPLPEAVMEIIDRRRKAGTVYGLVFPGPNDGKVFSGWSRLLGRLREASKVEDFGFHAVRRGFVTALANHGFDADLLDGMLNHSASETRSGVKGVYNRSERLQDRCRAMMAWAELVMAAVDDAEVIELKGRAA